MTALDMTADAEEYREIARLFIDDIGGTPLHDYAYRGEIAPGLSWEIRRHMSLNESMPARNIDFATRAANSFTLGRLLAHVGALEDRLNEDRACERSPTGWHEWANNEQCCHCGKDVP